MIIALLNKSLRYRSAGGLLRQMAEAVSLQLSQHVAPAWGMVPWKCQYIEDGGKVPAGAHRLWILDNADQANALGYHGQDPSGFPYGRVFVKPIISNGGSDVTGSFSVSVTISHEACEMMVNPEINSWRHNKNGQLYCEELCDAVQSDSYSIVVGGTSVAVSNFLLPAWFDYAPVKGSKFDYLGKLSGPFTMSSGGYVITMKNGRISNTFGSQEMAGKFAMDAGKFHDAARGMRVRAMNNNPKLTPAEVLGEKLTKAVEVKEIKKTVTDQQVKLYGQLSNFLKKSANDKLADALTIHTESLQDTMGAK